MADFQDIDNLEQLYRENPTQWFAILADEYRKAGRLARAVEIVRAGIEERPNHSSAHIVLGRCLVDLAEYDQAAETFERVLELDGENIIELQTLTWMAEHRNDIVEAKRWLGRLLEVHPTNAEAQLVQQRLDEFQEAPAKRRRMRSGE